MFNKNQSAVAILTNFQEFHPGYSLTGIVCDQIRMLLRYGHEVYLFVNERYNDKYDHLHLLPSVGENTDRFHLIKKVPFGHLTDYPSMINWTEEHQHLSTKTGQVLSSYFEKHGISYAFCHDWIFTGWNLPYAGGVRYASIRCPNVSWFHWVHSVPSLHRDWWKLNFYGEQHFIIFPNETDRQRVAEQFHTTRDRVLVIPHIKDPRVWFNFSDDSWNFTTKFPKILTSDICQIYPASCDRLTAKGVNYLVKMFGYWKKLGLSVFLCIANQWATGRNRKEDISQYIKMAEENGLVHGQEFVFTSTVKDSWATGIPSRVLRELLQLSNVFIFPTKEESFGLVGPEACLTGVLPVFNKSLGIMPEIYNHQGLYFDFGSFHHNFEPQQGMDTYLEAVCRVIIQHLKDNPIFNTKTLCRQKFNLDVLYLLHYAPAMERARESSEACFLNPTLVSEVDKADKNLEIFLSRKPETQKNKKVVQMKK